MKDTTEFKTYIIQTLNEIKSKKDFDLYNYLFTQNEETNKIIIDYLIENIDFVLDNINLLMQSDKFNDLNEPIITVLAYIINQISKSYSESSDIKQLLECQIGNFLTYNDYNLDLIKAYASYLDDALTDLINLKKLNDTQLEYLRFVLNSKSSESLIVLGYVLDELKNINDNECLTKLAEKLNDKTTLCIMKNIVEKYTDYTNHQISEFAQDEINNIIDSILEDMDD